MNIASSLRRPTTTAGRAWVLSPVAAGVFVLAALTGAGGATAAPAPGAPETSTVVVDDAAHALTPAEVDTLTRQINELQSSGITATVVTTPKGLTASKASDTAETFAASQGRFPAQDAGRSSAVQVVLGIGEGDSGSADPRLTGLMMTGGAKARINDTDRKVIEKHTLAAAFNNDDHLTSAFPAFTKALTQLQQIAGGKHLSEPPIDWTSGEGILTAAGGVLVVGVIVVVVVLGLSNWVGTRRRENAIGRYRATARQLSTVPRWATLDTAQRRALIQSRHQGWRPKLNTREWNSITDQEDNR